MKKIVICLMAVFTAGAAFCDEKAERDTETKTLSAKLGVMQSKSDKAIPAAELQKAVGVVLLDRIKAGFGFAYEGGGGVALLRAPKGKNWGQPAFLASNNGNF